MSSGSGSHALPGLLRHRWSTRPFSNGVRDFAAEVEVPVEQEPGVEAVDHPRAAPLEVGRPRNVGDRHHRAALESHRAVVEHVWVHVHGHLPAVLHDGVDRVRQRRHVVPVSVADGDRLDLAQANAEIAAVADEDRAFRAGIEQHGVAHAARLRYQLQPETEIGRKQRLAGNHLGAGEDDVGELGDREQCLADVGVADVVGDHLDDERVDRLERRTADFGHWMKLSIRVPTILGAPARHNRGRSRPRSSVTRA